MHKLCFGGSKLFKDYIEKFFASFFTIAIVKSNAKNFSNLLLEKTSQIVRKSMSKVD